MDSSTHSLTRRLSFESTTTSEFEVVPRERTSSGSTVGESYCRGISSSPSPSPPTSFRVPDLHIEHNASEQESLTRSEPGAEVDQSPVEEESIRSFANVASQASGSDLSTMARESAGMLEQVFHELFTIKRRNSVEEKLEEEVKQLIEEKEELLVKLSSQKVDSTKAQSTSWLHRIIVVGIIIAAIAMYLNCYAQLLKKQRHTKDLEEQLSIMNELVEKLGGGACG
ncbi:hypothetical protein OSTOST_08051 [Ostertagia ostertagi]